MDNILTLKELLNPHHKEWKEIGYVSNAFATQLKVGDRFRILTPTLGSYVPDIVYLVQHIKTGVQWWIPKRYFQEPLSKEERIIEKIKYLNTKYARKKS